MDSTDPATRQQLLGTLVVVGVTVTPVGAVDAHPVGGEVWSTQDAQVTRPDGQVVPGRISIEAGPHGTRLTVSSAGAAVAHAFLPVGGAPQVALGAWPRENPTCWAWRPEPPVMHPDGIDGSQMI